MTDNEIAAIVQREIALARGYDSDVLSTKRATALDLYYGNLPAAAEGRSQIVSTDVADSVHAVLAQISPVVRTSLIEFEATSQEDEQQAQTETDFVRVTIERSSGYDTTDKAMFDALLIGNGWLHCYVDEVVTQTEQRFPGKLSEEQIYALQSQLPANTVATVRTGADVTIFKLETTRKTLRIECVPPEEMLYSECGADFDINELRFIGRKRLYTVAQLAALGISADKIATLPDATNDDQGERAREGALQNDGNLEAVQDANRLKQVYCCYIRLQKGKNKVELRHVWVGENNGATLLNEPADYIPFITGSAVPMPHRITGNGIADLLASVEKGKTHVLRQYMDNLSVMNASRIGAVEGQVNMSDLTNGRINGVVRLRSPDALVPLPSADIGPQAIAALQYFDTVRAQRVGASLDFNEVQAQLMGTSATAAAGQLSKVEQMGGWFAGNIVRTMLLPLFLMVHRILRTEMAGPVMARIGGKWAQTDTSTWVERDVTDVQMGLTTTEKAERMLALSQTIQQLQLIIQSGGNGVVTDLPRLHNAMSDWIRTANLGSPDQYLIDPSSPEAQQALQAQQQQQEQDRSSMMQIQMAMTKLQHSFELEKQARELNYKEWSDRLNAEIEEAKMVGNGVIEIKKLNVQKAQPSANA